MREKLIDLLKDEGCSLRCSACKWRKETWCIQARQADKLIANGVVVVSKNENTTGWIPVTERLPKLHEDVLVYFRGRIEVQCSYLDGFLTKTVTHWMPLPTPPKDGDT